MENPILLETSAQIDLVFDSMLRIAMRDREGWMLQKHREWMLQSLKTLIWNWPTTSDQYSEWIFVTEQFPAVLSHKILPQQKQQCFMESNLLGFPHQLCVFDNVQQIISPTDDGDSKEERKDKKSSCQVKELVLVHKAGIYLSVLSFALCFALKQAGVDVSTMLRKV